MKMYGTSKLNKLVNLKKAIRKMPIMPQPVPTAIKHTEPVFKANPIQGPIADRFKETTISIAFPASCILTMYSPKLQTYLVGQIARAASIYRVDEIIIIDDCLDEEEKKKEISTTAEFISQIMQYLETPQYLRKALFPFSDALQFIGLVNPLDAPHHLRQDEWSIYREGVATFKYIASTKNYAIDIGLKKDCQVDEYIEKGTRVTLRVEDNPNTKSPYYSGQIVNRSKPKEELGHYWGYSVRTAKTLSEAVVGKSMKEYMYDLAIILSEDGKSLKRTHIEEKTHFSKALLIFGNPDGFDSVLASMKGKIEPIPSYKINTCFGQGTDSIKVEESIMISLALLAPTLRG